MNQEAWERQLGPCSSPMQSQLLGAWHGAIIPFPLPPHVPSPPPNRSCVGCGPWGQRGIFQARTHPLPAWLL